MARDAISVLPKGILHTRTLINSLAKESQIKLSTKTPLWSETELICKPFTAKLSYDRNNIEIVLEIILGYTPNTSYLQDIMNSLPVPINYKYSLEPNSLITIVREIAVTPNTTKIEVANFFTDSILAALVVIQSLLVNSVLTSDSLDAYMELLPNPSQPWMFPELVRQILQQN